MKKLILSLAASVIALGVSAQAWSLEDCVNYAIDHNITVKSQELQVKRGELDITAAKDRFLPSLDASSSQSFNFGRGLTAENTYADRNTSNFQWGVNFSLPLFQGMSEYRRLNLAKSSLQQMLYEQEATKDNVALNVISQYLLVLYSKEVEQSARSQAKYSAYEVSRQKALVDAGKVAEADLYDAEAQAAQDQLQVVTAQNDTQTALVNLANLLQLPSVEGFDIKPLDDAEPMIPHADDVYSDALTVNNSILGARQGLKVADDNISVAKTGYIPTLSFNAGVGSSYYTVSGFDSESFAKQMRHNLSTYLGFSLRIPIFDGFSTRNNVRTAKIQKYSAELELEQRESDLYKNIQLAYYQAKGARERYMTSEETVEKTKLSFDATREKYNLGRATPVEFEQAKNNLFRTEVSRIQAHYEYLLRYRILMFYKSNRL